jgi:hypothetical protein
VSHLQLPTPQAASRLEHVREQGAGRHHRGICRLLRLSLSRAMEAHAHGDGNRPGLGLPVRCSPLLHTLSLNISIR